jgi:hypothetical protein
LEHGFYFSIYIYILKIIYILILGISWNFIIPTDEVHHFSEGWRKTTNQIMLKTNHETSTASSMFFSKKAELMDFGLAESDSDRNWPHAILPGWDLGSQNDASTGLRGKHLKIPPISNESYHVLSCETRIGHPLAESDHSESITPHVGVSHPPQPHWGRGVTALRRAS